MGAEQKEQGDQKGSFCFVAVYDDRDDEQLGRQPSEDVEEDLEMILEEEDNEASSSSAFDGSARSRSSSSLDMVDDASSSSLSTFSQSNRALYDLSQLMLNLPIKRGLSKFYQGKSQSFTSLARVTSLEDLPKKTSSSGGYATRMKACRSYGGTFNFNTHQQRSPHIISPKPTISKKSSSSSLSCLRGKSTTHRRSFKCKNLL